MLSSSSSTPGKSTTFSPSTLSSRLYKKGTVVRFDSVVPMGTCAWGESEVIILEFIDIRCTRVLAKSYNNFLESVINILINRPSYLQYLQ